MAEIMRDARMDRAMVAVSHHDRVDLYGYGPAHVEHTVQIHASSPRGEALAETILQEQLGPYKQLMPHAMFGEFGKLDTVYPRKLTIPEYEWWQCYGDSCKIIGDAAGS